MSRARTAAALILAATTLAPTAALAAERTPDRPWVAGIAMSLPGTPQTDPGYWCSTGLPAKKNGRWFLLTARHCVDEIGQPVHTGWRAGKRERLGTVAGISRALDVAAIETTGDVAPAYWRGKKTQAITQIASLRIGSTACQHGVRSGTSCGIVVQSIERDGRGRPTRVIGRVTRGAAALPGDSGGTVVDTQGRPVGVISATSADRAWVAWTPATAALDAWHLTAVTR